jgi:hypothetical protein
MDCHVAVLLAMTGGNVQSNKMGGKFGDEIYLTNRLFVCIMRPLTDWKGVIMKKLIFLCGALIIGCTDVTCMVAGGDFKLLVPVHRPLGADGRIIGDLTLETRKENEQANRRIRQCSNYGAVNRTLEGYTRKVLLRAAERIVAEAGIPAPDRLAKRTKRTLICWFADNALEVSLDVVARVLKDVYSEVNGINETDAAAPALDPLQVLSIANLLNH